VRAPDIPQSLQESRHAHNRPPTTDQLRRAIDSGATGDKVHFPDPAAAPLGTDDEAGGFSPTPARAETALSTEAKPSLRRAHAESGRSALWAVVVALLCAVLLIALAIWLR